MNTIERQLQLAFIKKEHLVAVFFDLEKAYDTTWKYGIMNDFLEIGLKGRLPIFVQNFLSNREFKVRVGSTFRSGGGVVDNTLDYQSRGRKIDPPLLRSFG